MLRPGFTLRCMLARGLWRAFGCHGMIVDENSSHIIYLINENLFDLGCDPVTFSHGQVRGNPYGYIDDHVHAKTVSMNFLNIENSIENCQFFVYFFSQFFARQGIHEVCC